VKGRKRQIAVDTQGNMHGVHIHAANESENVGGIALLDRVLEQLPRVRAVLVDQGYKKQFIAHIKKKWKRRKIKVIVSKRIKDAFCVVPKRWIVERCFAWCGGYRLLSKEYEKSVSSAVADMHICFIRMALRMLTEYP